MTSTEPYLHYGSPSRRERKGQKAYFFFKVMTENSPNLMREMDIQIYEWS